MTRIIVPVIYLEKPNKYVVYPHFGKAPEFAIIDIYEKSEPKKRFIENEYSNEEEHSGHGKYVIDKIIKEDPDIMVVTNIGEMAYNYLKDAGIKIMKPESKDLDQIIEEYKSNKLVPFTNPH
ncbi:MAG: NifB/NifX family molybdenum-iron cluster-binding protein [Candidatus Micrarchaeia archaeon]